VLDPGTSGGVAVAAATVPDPILVDAGDTDGGVLPYISVPEDMPVEDMSETPELELALF
jgi:hypothetical protein